MCVCARVKRESLCGSGGERGARGELYHHVVCLQGCGVCIKVRVWRVPYAWYVREGEGMAFAWLGWCERGVRV